jgi:hypothetical protein
MFNFIAWKIESACGLSAVRIFCAQPFAGRGKGSPGHEIPCAGQDLTGQLPVRGPAELLRPDRLFHRRGILSGYRIYWLAEIFPVVQKPVFGDADARQKIHQRCVR